MGRQITRIAHQANPTRVEAAGDQEVRQEARKDLLRAPQFPLKEIREWPKLTAIDAYSREKKLMRVKAYDEMKLPQLPKTAADARLFRNSVFNLVCRLAKGDESLVHSWIAESTNPKADLESSLPFPILDRVLGSKLLELSKNTKFAMLFQPIQEQEQLVFKQPKGRKLLRVIFERFKMEKDRGIALTQTHLLGLKMSGTDIKALEDFRQRFDFVYQALEVSERPSDQAIRSTLFEQLKGHPKMALVINRLRNASPNSSKRTWPWLYAKLGGIIEIHQLDENVASIDQVYTQSATKPQAAPAKTKEGKDKNDKKKAEKKGASSSQKPKDSKDPKPKEANAAPAKRGKARARVRVARVRRGTQLLRALLG